MVSQTVTPFPAASPSALITRGWLNLLRISIAYSLDPVDQYFAVGILFSIIRALDHSLLASN